jgi:hypothetical protein
MANMNKDQENGNVQQGMGQNPQGMQGDIGSPISNEAYNVISALHAKLEGLEAYRKYAKDGGPQLWQKLTSTEIEGVKQLCDELERIVKDGKLRMRQPGKTS